MDHIIVLGFSLFLFVGSLLGLKAGSKISLFMGIISGSLVAVGDWIIRSNHSAGFIYLMVIAGMLVVVFLQRLLKTKKVMPSGMLLGMGLLFFVFTIVRFFN